MPKTRTVRFSYTSKASARRTHAGNLDDSHNDAYANDPSSSPSTTAASNGVDPAQLVKILDSYTAVSPDADQKWQEASVKLATVLRDWRTLYKQLDQRKRYLKRTQTEDKKQTSEPASVHDVLAGTPSTSPDTSANDKSESETSDVAHPRNVKRRRTGK